MTERWAGKPLVESCVTVSPDDALKPCPFCGGKAKLVREDVEPQGDPWYGKKMEHFIRCECGACLFDGGFHEGFYDPETRAVAAWNQRAGEPNA